MERKTNKAKLDIFKFLIKLAEIVPSMKVNKYTLTRVFLYAEFISAMKTVKNNTVFMKT